MDQRTAQRQPAPRLRTNLDTDFLKLIAILSMLLDHIGAVFFPEYPAFRWVGRLAFPIFCYCMTVGLLYTRDIKRYLGRLGLFALISQPCYILATHPWDWQTEWMNWNIFFTLFLSLLAMWGFQTRRWWLFAAAFLCVSLFNFDYSGNGILLMLIFFLCRERPGLGAGLYILFWLPALWSGSPEDPRAPAGGRARGGLDCLCPVGGSLHLPPRPDGDQGPQMVLLRLLPGSPADHRRDPAGRRDMRRKGARLASFWRGRPCRLSISISARSPSPRPAAPARTAGSCGPQERGRSARR